MSEKKEYRAKTMSELLELGMPVSTAAMHREQALQELCETYCQSPSCRMCPTGALLEVQEMSRRVAQRIQRADL